MSYEKPQVTLVASAVETIKGCGGPKRVNFLDCIEWSSATAYEADE